MAGGYKSVNVEEGNVPTDDLLMLTVEADSSISLESSQLGSGPLAQASFLKTPETAVYILAGGTLERWALVSKYVAPASPCDLKEKNSCLLDLHPTTYDRDTVNWLECDRPCKRWFQVFCLKMTHKGVYLIFAFIIQSELQKHTKYH